MMTTGWCSRAFVVLSLLSLYVYGQKLVGGFQNRNPTDEDVVQAAKFAVNAFNSLSNEEYDYKLMKIVSAATQVIAGVRYDLNVEMGKTNCNREFTYDISSCDIIQDPKLARTYLCFFSVVEVPWENQESLVAVNCKVQQ
ncbi:cystatin-like isoform X2 [Eleutherodactylus coqui]|uniref:Cystatin domain-containing protein n=2 Tax=Eleutherodactylus coqui TaxID=57060 RepID=A0A8J6BL39_ELECQ|nr:hypothetical protein GDO78_014749 [Eleutherodactylus coqui]